MTTVLVTGGCGFIGSAFVRLVLRDRPDWRVVNFDALTYSGNLANLADVAADPRYSFARVDIADADALQVALDRLDETPRYLVHFAAESHVDRSISGPDAFVRTNITGTFHLLMAARAMPGLRYLQVSTDEVYGSLGDEGKFTEDTPLDPTSPYAASKAAADLIVQSFVRTYRLDAVITRCSNNYGPRQFPEKLIPLMILNASAGKPLPVYGTGMNVRNWIHVDDHCRGVLRVLEAAAPGSVYNLGGDVEWPNLRLVQLIAQTVAGGLDLIRFVADRPGHDWRYAMDHEKATRDLGWRPEIAFDEGIAATAAWYLQHPEWWQAVLSGEYLRYVEAQYGSALQEVGAP